MSLPRKHLHRYEADDGIRFITFSCFRRLPLLKTPAIKSVMVDALRDALAQPGWRLIAWVIMPEHAHLVAQSEGAPLAPVLARLKARVARTIITRWRRLNARVLARLAVPRGFRFFQPGGGFDRNVRDAAELCRTIRYVHMNPVERGLAREPCDWEWSSARWWAARPALIECQYPADGSDWSRWEGYFHDPINRPRGPQS